MKVIQVGIGGMGNAWLGAAQRSPKVDFAAFVEIDADIADQQAARYGLDRALIFRTLPEALARVAADAVINVTPPQFHREISVLSLEAGLPVLSEKPLAGTMDDARAIVDAADRTGLLHSVAQNYRYRPLTQTIKRVLDSGMLGAVGAVHVEFYKGPRFGGFREEMPQPLIVDMAIHHFDLLRFFLGSEARSIGARSWNPPWSWYRGDASAVAQIDFASGVPASYVGSWCSQAGETSWNANWRFDCERGVLRVEDDSLRVQRLLGVGEGGGALRNQHSQPEIVPLLDMAREGQDYLLDEFVDAVNSGGSPATSAQDNIRTMELVFGAVRACATGETISLA
ncbi:MAG: Gfo/Idh/MocA family oxidoreductase [Chloroflexi bacterium]|nr:Gfo/Idh/MocA family oxidoreductase [Chloroflexota bacterium]MCY4247255.1 Gfo/Idh/MocA family oxidoreductase [Chloroflexota bacterium]